MSSGSQPVSQTTTTELSPEQRQLMNSSLGRDELRGDGPSAISRSRPTCWDPDPSQTAGQEGALQSAGVQTGSCASGGWNEQLLD